MTTEHRKTKRRSAVGNRLLVLHDPAQIRLPRATGLGQEGCVGVQAHDEVQALWERQSRPWIEPSLYQRIGLSPSIISYPITCNLSVFRTVLEGGQPEASVDRGDHQRPRYETPRIGSKASRAFFRMASLRGLLLGVLLAGCQSTQDVYLAQATDHATAVELEHGVGHPNYEQALDTGHRRWLYHQDEVGQAAEILRRSVKITD